MLLNDRHKLYLLKVYQTYQRHLLDKQVTLFCIPRAQTHCFSTQTVVLLLKHVLWHCPKQLKKIIRPIPAGFVVYTFSLITVVWSTSENRAS